MRILNTIVKDLKIILSDKKAVAIIILMPVILTTILSFALKGTFMEAGDMAKLQVAIVKNYDKDADDKKILNTLNSGLLGQGMDKDTLDKLKKASERLDIEELFFQKFLGNENITRILEYRLENEDKALQLLKSEEVSAVIVLPEHFIYDLKISALTPLRNKADIKVITHPDKNFSGLVVRQIVEAFSDTMSAVLIGKNVLMETALEQGLGPEVFRGLEQNFDKINHDLAEIKVETKPEKVAGKRKITSFDYYAVAMMTMFILFSAGLGGKMLLEEKQNITYQRMIISGLPRYGILAGKFFTVFLLALLQVTVMIVFSSVVLHVQWGNKFLTALISLCSTFAIGGIGVMIAAAAFKAGNDKMANVFDTLVIQTMALLGGSFFPVDILPSFLQKLSIFSLNGISLKSYLKVMMGYGFTEIRTYLLALLVVGAVFILLAVFIFNLKGRDEGCSV